MAKSSDTAQIKKPGDVVQIDTVHLTLANELKIKQFTAYCPVSRWSLAEVYSSSNSKNAADFLNKVIKEMPFKVSNIQTDGGSEFMKDFEISCKEKNIPIHLLPPRSPKLNGAVERNNKAWRYSIAA